MTQVVYHMPNEIANIIVCSHLQFGVQTRIYKRVALFVYFCYDINNN